MSDDARHALDDLLALMRRLRDPAAGCPWDLEQDFTSIAPYTIEEAYEVADRIAVHDMPGLEDELGDLLFQVVFHAQMGSEAGHFSFASIARRLHDKMVRRHPHVFPPAGGLAPDIASAADQTRAWENHKAKERAGRGILDDVPLALPALMRALKLQKRAARVGFDWGAARPILDKVAEEAREIVDAAEAGANLTKLTDEVGDLLFVIVNLARHLDVDPEAALRSTNAKFERRFRHIERSLEADGRAVASTALEDLEALWRAAKALEPNEGVS